MVTWHFYWGRRAKMREALIATGVILLVLVVTSLQSLAEENVIAETISLTHHEKWNGTDYPNGLKREEIPLVGRIAGICDVFDALISERPYKKAWSVEKAFEEIQSESGTHFDPKLVELFVKSKAEFAEIVQNIKKR
jgi:putative two-component system response regulator